MKSKRLCFSILYYVFSTVIYAAVHFAANALYDLSVHQHSLGSAAFFIFVFYLLVIPAVTFILTRFSLLKLYVDPFAAIEFPLFMYISMLINGTKYSNLASAFSLLNNKLSSDGGIGFMFFATLFAIGLAASRSFKRVKEQNLGFRLLKKACGQHSAEGDTWNFDFKSLPEYDRRERIPYVYDKFYPLPKNDMLLCLYSITEATMLNYVGNLAVLKNKASPELILNIWNGIDFTDNFSASNDENIVFLQASVYDKAAQKIHRPIIIFDFEQNRFAIFKTENTDPCYTVMQIGDDVFKVKASNPKNTLDGQTIVLSDLSWFCGYPADGIAEKIINTVL